MAFQDPQTLTVGADSITLPRTGSTGTTGIFRSPDQRHRFVVAHNSGKRVQHVARLEFANIVANPLVPSANQVVSAAVTLTVNLPLNGLDSAGATQLANALIDWATPTNIGKLIGSEN